MADPATATPRPPAHRLQKAIGFGLTALGVAVALTVMIVMLALPRAGRPETRSQPQRNGVAYAPRSSRLDAKDWITVKNIVRLRAMALAPGRTSMYRAF